MTPESIVNDTLGSLSCGRITAYPSITTCALPDTLVTVSPWITPRRLVVS